MDDLARMAADRRGDKKSLTGSTKQAIWRGWGGLWMPLVSAIVLPFAFAPFGQFYLAWIGLVPWLMFTAQPRRPLAVFLMSWAAGCVYFGINIWWLGFVTVPGTIGSIWYMGFYWGLAAVLVRWLVPRGAEGGPATGGWGGVLTILVIAGTWTGSEWLRGWMLTGWPWSFLGHSQTPLLPLVQIADLTGVYGVTFLIVSVNVLIWLAIYERRIQPILPAAGVVVVLIAASLVYGWMRLGETTTSPGPRVLVVQSNFPQSNTGQKGATQEELLAYHVRETEAALQTERAAGRRVDLVAWSETMMPDLNPEARLALGDTRLGPVIEQAVAALSKIARDYNVPLLVGGGYSADFVITSEGYILPRDQRNVAYYFGPDGMLSDSRYDKIHLVPFGEFIPFKRTVPWLFDLFLALGPRDYDYTLTAGAHDALTVFALPPAGGAPAARFVTPICFEDSDASLVRRMFDGGDAKRADFIVNITNDGWFSQPQLSQHLQIARFRSIENRVPTARSVNTGISAFIDSTGRITERLPAQVAGALVTELRLDRRYTTYTQWGDWFAAACAMLVAAGVVGRGAGAFRARRRGAGDRNSAQQETR